MAQPLPQTPPGVLHGAMSLTLGIEEEFVLLDPATLQTVDIAHGAVEALASTGGGIVAHEFFRSQVEFATPVCESASDAREAIHAFRDDLGEWAWQAGAIAAGTGLRTAPGRHRT